MDKNVDASVEALIRLGADVNAANNVSDSNTLSVTMFIHRMA